MLKITDLYINGGKIKENIRSAITDSAAPVFSWAISSNSDNNFQYSFHVLVYNDDEILWDSGIVKSDVQSVKYEGKPLPPGKHLTLSVTVTDKYGEESEPYETIIINGVLTDDEFYGKWIGATEENDHRAIYFRKDFSLRGSVKSACLYIAGIGYHQVTVNGIEADDSLLEPAHSNYAKTVYYSVHPDISNLFSKDSNTIGVVVADGWRNNTTAMTAGAIGDRVIEFFGKPLLWAMISIEYTDGTSDVIATDESWNWSFGAITYASIFNGEVFDSRLYGPSWNIGEFDSDKFNHVLINESPCKEMRPMALEPIRIVDEYPALEITQPKKGMFVVDFGQNLAGFARLVLPDDLKEGQTITIRFTEELNEDGTIYTDILREAKCTDTYIASGDGRDLWIWQPTFTYHGFRYAEVCGLDHLDRRDITALLICTDLKNDSFFSCGSALVNQIQKNIIMTEMDNMHSILTDCPQRDERMGWMNDATVRFEETPYNFDIGRIFPKIVRDIRNEQREEGQFTCCCPYYFGGLPADPVCSSYLVAGYEALMHTGNYELIKEAYTGFEAWENFLLSRSDDYIVNYSYYGDWAAPGYACEGGIEGAKNTETEGILMSTGYSYLNCILLSKMAELIGRDDDTAKYTDLSEKIKSAFLSKWWNPETATVGNGSQGAQAFALWLGLIPDEYCAAAAKVMRDDLVSRDYKFTTGNLNTRYLFDMLTKYGYVNDAWYLLTNETYPSYGFMIQNEATTIWERFELKKAPGMNSHNHPMYGAVGYYFYAYICGIIPTSPGYETVRIEPYFPDDLTSAHAVIDSIKGDISVRWSKRYGKLYMFVQIPFGVKAEVVFDGNTSELGSGYYIFEKTLND